MACNLCTTVCPVHPCYDNLYIAKATALNQYRVELTNIGSGRMVSENITANASGYLILTGGTWADFLNGGSQYRVRIFLLDYSVSPATTTNIPVDFYVITGFSGAYYSIGYTLSSTQYDCILFETEMIYDSAGLPIELDNQYLINEDA